MKTPRISLYILLGVILAAILQACWYYPRLPETVASHFDASGVANGYGSKIALLVFQVIFIPVTGLLFTGFGWLLSQIPKSFINVPYRDYYLSDEKKGFTFTVMGNALRWFGIGTMVLLLIVFHQVNQANLSQPPILPLPASLLIGYLVFTLVWSIWLILKFRKPAEQQPNN
jgi:uncharacterized membrane protein